MIELCIGLGPPGTFWLILEQSIYIYIYKQRPHVRVPNIAFSIFFFPFSIKFFLVLPNRSQ